MSETKLQFWTFDTNLKTHVLNIKHQKLIVIYWTKVDFIIKTIFGVITHNNLMFIVIRVND